MRLTSKIFVILILVIVLNFYLPLHGWAVCKLSDWDPVSAGPITSWTAPLCGKGKVAVQPFFFYNRTRGTFDDEGESDSLPEGDRKFQYQEQIFIQYGLSEHLEFDAQTVYQENYIKQSGQKAHYSGLGDSYMFLRYCGIEESDFMPQLTALFQVKAPTGKYQHADPDKLGTDLMGAGSGGGSWDQGVGFAMTKKMKPFILHGDFIYSFSQPVRVDGVNTRYGQYLNYDIGIEYFMTCNWNLELELNGFLQGDRRESGNYVPASDVNSLVLSPGIGWSNDKIQTLIAYQRILTGTNTDANDSVVVTVVYSF